MDAPPQGHHIEDASENVEILHSALQILAESAGFDIRDIWDEIKVRTCLEATGGLVNAAAEMYWDDFLAREALPEAQNAEPGDEAAAEDSDMEEDDDDAVFVGQQQQQQPPPLQQARFVVPHVQNNDDSGNESPPDNVESISLAAEFRRMLLLRRNRRQRRSRRGQASSSGFEDESVISDDDVVMEARKKKAKKRKEVSPCNKRQKIDHNDDVVMSDDEKDGYISDTDWLWTSMMRHEGDRIQLPSDFLWGEDEVPTTWVSAAVELSRNGAAFVRAPDNGDFGHSKWKDSSAQGIPAPYHCRSITLVNSLITALLYSGVGVQPGPCIAVGRQPLIEIANKLRDVNPNEIRKRLVDSLTTLLHIAATSSAERKRKALESMLMSEDIRWQKIQQKLKLVPTFTIPRLSNELTYKVSYSNIQDMKSYVDSSIDSFTETGGLAMLLDLIVAIHGASALRRMSSSNDKESIINCTCWKRFVPTDKVEMLKLKSRARESPKLDTTPRDLGCMSRSTELLSLLVTGKTNATSSELNEACKLLGFGIISEDADLPSNPAAKVWLVRGPTQWSVLLWESGDFSSSDPVAKFRHLNLWYGGDNVTELQLSMRGEPDTFPDDVLALTAHEDDKKYYPNKYRLWRYKFSEDGEWCSYHVLKPNQQRSVEDSFGPRLAVLLRRQWPGVTIDSISRHDPMV